jgi:hypothetical protein
VPRTLDWNVAPEKTPTPEPPVGRRPRRLARLLLLAFPPLIAGAVAFGAWHEARRGAETAEGIARLLQGDGAGARFLLGMPSRHPRREAAWRLALAVGGGDVEKALDAETTTALLVPAIHGTFLRGDYEGVLRLCALGAGDPRVPAYQAGALLELGRDAEAQAAAASQPAAFRTGGLGREVDQAVRLRQEGAVSLLRDRAGNLLGSLDAAGVVKTVDDEGTAYLPPLVTRAIASRGAKPGFRLTVDRALSRLALHALGPYRGTIVLLDPRTGAVLAAVSDARTRAEGGTAAFEQRREPASIAKIITAAAAYRAGLDPDAEIAKMTCAGQARYGNGSLWCAYPGGPLHGLGHALAISCNVAFANLGERLGRQKVVEEFRRWGFDLPADALPGAGSVRLPEGDARQLADLSVGLSATDITPVHGALMAAVIANEGRMPVPALLGAEDGVLGRSPRPIGPRPARPVLDPAWVPALTRAMGAVTDEGGTAEHADPPAFQVAMKTGTAAEGALGYHVNYIGAGPLPTPTVAFCVRVTHQPTSRHVNEAAREVLRSLLQSLASTP